MPAFPAIFVANSLARDRAKIAERDRAIFIAWTNPEQPTIGELARRYRLGPEEIEVALRAGVDRLEREKAIYFMFLSPGDRTVAQQRIKGLED